MQRNKTILIAIPTNKYIEPETFKSIYDLKIPKGYFTNFQFFYGYQIDQIRNLIADWAKHYDYLLSVDSDIVLPEDALVKMIAHDKDIVSGIYLQRMEGVRNVEIYDENYVRIPLENLTDVQEIGACGFGCVLIKQQVFWAMGYPHFVYKSALNHEETFSEDVYFCKKARECGYSVWVDPSIKCTHIGMKSFKI